MIEVDLGQLDADLERIEDGDAGDGIADGDPLAGLAEAFDDDAIDRGDDGRAAEPALGLGDLGADDRHVGAGRFDFLGAEAGLLLRQFALGGLDLGLGLAIGRTQARSLAFRNDPLGDERGLALPFVAGALQAGLGGLELAAGGFDILAAEAAFAQFELSLGLALESRQPIQLDPDGFAVEGADGLAGAEALAFLDGDFLDAALDLRGQINHAPGLDRAGEFEPIGHVLLLGAVDLNAEDRHLRPGEHRKQQVDEEDRGGSEDTAAGGSRHPRAPLLPLRGCTWFSPRRGQTAIS
ncbi:MAG: hypothetical protein BWZ08_02577 [candidate division BRC1 bacterium ADurb.BinA292]|nr:MAG: hypothetical protein BWZ08_02577 [candidate division BRC1 bacterium ADurb.BinA292]